MRSSSKSVCGVHAMHTEYIFSVLYESFIFRDIRKAQMAQIQMFE